MSERDPALALAVAPPSADLATPTPPASAPDSPVRRLHNLLRGRYRLAILLAAVFGVLGGWYGWTSRRPVYRASGLLYVSPSLPSPEDPGGISVLPMFEGFMAFQVQMLQSERASRLAMDTDVWKATGEPAGPAGQRIFELRRAIVRIAGTQHVHVHFADERPSVAVAGVRALIEAYLKLANELNYADRHLESTRGEIDTLTRRSEAVDQDILARTSAYGGVEGMQIRHRASVEQVVATENEIERVRTAIAATTSNEPSGAAAEMTAGEIAVDSPPMAQALFDVALLEAEAETLAARLGDRHDGLIDVRTRLRVRREWIEQFVKDWNRRHRDAPHRTGDPDRPSLAELRAREARLAERLQKLQDENKRIGETNGEVDRLQTESESLRVRLRQREALKDQLTAQLVGTGRVQVVDSGSLPTLPYKDGRKSYGMAFGFLGGALGVLAVLLLALRDRRLKGAEDMARGSASGLSQLRLLGLLPSFPVDAPQGERGDLAAHYVHQVRMLLQIGPAREPGSCLCVTGPGVGSGKTTVTMALAQSFASSGSRVLLVDADLAGRALTGRVEQMLWSRLAAAASGGGAPESSGEPGGTPAPGVLVEPPASAARAADPSSLLDLMTRSIDRLGLRGATDAGVVDDVFALADLRFSGAPRDELAARLVREVSRRRPPDAGSPTEWIPRRIAELGRDRPEINGEPVARYVYPTGHPGMRFLPLRGLGRDGAVSVSTIARILERLRSEFDLVLLDTGPVPGGVEASIVATQVDGVVLVVSPGDDRADAERAVAHLKEVGAVVSGVVFNRASERDVAKVSRSYSYGASRGTE